MDSMPNIYQRINAVMREVSYIQKDPKKLGLQYSFASHDSVTSALRGPMVEHGIVYHPTKMELTVDGNRVQMSLVIRFVNIDNPGDFIDVPSYGFGIDSQDKGVGKAFSYAVKYGLLKTFGLETGDDPENDQSAKHVPASEVAAAKKSKPWNN